MARAVFSLQYDCPRTKTVITQRTCLLTGVKTLCFVSSCVFSLFTPRPDDTLPLSVCSPDSPDLSRSCPAAPLLVDDICFPNLPANYGDKHRLPSLGGANSPALPGAPLSTRQCRATSPRWNAALVTQPFRGHRGSGCVSAKSPFG